MSEARLIKDGWIDEYLRYTKTQESPELFHRWTAFSVLAGVLKRRVWLERGHSRLYPNLYIVLVGPTGKCRKTTASEIGISILEQIEGIDIIREKCTPEGLISAMSTKDVLVSNNGKPEGGISIKQDASAFIHAPELSVFLGNQNYTTGLIELLTTLYDNKNIFNYHTQKRGRLSVKEPTLSFLGASNPEWLAKSFSEDAFGGGFMGRTLFVYQHSVDRKIAWPMLSDDQKAMSLTLKIDLHKIARLKGAFTIDKDAKDLYESWYIEYEGEMNGRLAGYYERKPTHILKIAMLLSIAKNDEMIISCEDIMNATDLLSQLEKTMQNAFAYIGTTNEAKIAEFILEILQSKGGIILHKDLFKDVRHRIRTSKEFNDIANTLEESGLMRIVMSEKGRTYYTPDKFREKEKREKEKNEKEASEKAKIAQLEERRIKSVTIQ